ncbi:hypothetical protein AB1Y20_008980 [Prymnesium parvum]|uniref:EF-hand domain-containing protein n=1 Tax=Prymnesium parvum TaxID=97485 RepID=A0AB34K2V7_PRYPA
MGRSRLHWSDTTPSVLAAQVAASDAATQAAILDALSEDAKRQVGLKYLGELEEEFARADINTDGKLSFKEFQLWAKATVERKHAPDEVKLPATPAQLRAVVVQTMVPYMGFGIVDNSMMILSGEAIDNTIGVMFGISTLAAAALGNSFSNGLGMVLHGAIERFACALGLPDPRLTVHQRGTDVVKNVKMAAGIAGVILGCMLGMFPLLLFNAPNSHDSRNSQADASD